MHRHGSFVLAVAALLASCASPSGAGGAAPVSASVGGPAQALPPLPPVPPVTPVPPAPPAAASPGPEAGAAKLPADASVARCPPGMALVEGDYCRDAHQSCLVWVDPPSNPFARCATFAPSTCGGTRTHERFCVDRDEYTPHGESLPLGDASWTEARAVCERQDKRLCKETEWEFACEGEAMLPYPTGYDRNAGACNVDRGDLVDPATRRLRDLRQPPSALELCTSPFGVRSMSGNVDEWVWRDRSPGEWRSALKGGWWMPARDRCRPATTAHDERFHDIQTGVRCCADAG